MANLSLPDTATLQRSAIAYLQELGYQDEAQLLGRSLLEYGTATRTAHGTAKVNITIRCSVKDLQRFSVANSVWNEPTTLSVRIQQSLAHSLPAAVSIDNCEARTFLRKTPDRSFDEIERLIGQQKDLMISVATGGPRIHDKNAEFVERRREIHEILRELKLEDPNPFEDLWAWYGRWSSGDLPTYKSRRAYVQELYRPLLRTLLANNRFDTPEEMEQPTGWEKVDRIIDKIVETLDKASHAEDFQSVGLLCRECLISIAQSVFDPMRHTPLDNVTPSKADAYRMLEAYFSTEYSGGSNENLRAHAKASLKLANELQHKSTANFRDAALCAEAARSVIRIVAITSGRY